MTWDPKQLLENFRRAAVMAGVSLLPGDIIVEQHPAPHEPPKALPPGKMAVYVFSYGSDVLKVGKVGPQSAARYTSQHYNAASAKSTLAASLIKHGGCINVEGLDESNVSSWIKGHTNRVNFILNKELGIPVLNLLEAFLQCCLRPKFEGFASQRIDSESGRD